MLKKILNVVFYVFVAIIILTLIGFWILQAYAWFHLGLALSILIGVAILFSLIGIGWLFGNFMDWLFK